MRRRQLLASLGVVLVSPATALGQVQGAPIIGFLHTSPPGPGFESPSPQFRQALKDLGFTEGESVRFERRYAYDRYDLLPALAAELASLPASVLVAGTGPGARALKAATTTIPIVFWYGGDPAAEGLVPSLNHPGSNLTGVGMFNNALGPKRLELLRQLLPKATVFALLINSANSNADPQIKDAQEAARTAGVQLVVATASSNDEIDAAFAMIASQHAEGLIVGADPFIFQHREHLLVSAKQYALPLIGTLRDYAVAGGLMSYTASAPMQYELGNYVGRILKGERAGDLPIQRPTKFELVINLKTAEALGLTVPQLLLARADEVIE